MVGQAFRHNLVCFANYSFLVLGLLGTATLFAQTPESQAILSPQELFHRCYRTMVRAPVPRAHPIMERVKSGELSGPQGCLEILNLATLNPTGSLAVDTPESRKVLNTVNDFHRGWFASDDYTGAIVEHGEFFYGEGYIYDPGNPALYLTKALLMKDVPYSNVVLDNTYYIPMRDKFPAKRTYPLSGTAQFIYMLDFASRPAWNSPLFQEHGEFFGLRPISGTAEAGFSVPFMLEANHPFKVFEHFGAGFLGTPAYLPLNFGRSFNEVNDGGFRLPRRYTQTVVRDILCRELPVLRVEDGKKLIDTASTLPWKSQATCMQCHGTIDNMAEAMRNFKLGFSYPVDFNREVAAALVYQYPQVGTAYHQKEPSGKFRFRSFDGTLIEKDIIGLKGIGEALAETSDLYVCAARQYVEFFTGLRVNLDDAGDSDRQPLSPSDKLYREKVVDLGMGFAGHQDLRTLLKAIWESELFQKASMRDHFKVE